MCCVCAVWYSGMWQNVPQCVAVRCSVLQCIAVCCSVVQCLVVCHLAMKCVILCDAARCIILVCRNESQCVAVCCSVLQCVAVCCSVLQCAVVYCSVLQRVAVCCSVLQCVAVCCSMLQCVAVSRNVLRALHWMVSLSRILALPCSLSLSVSQTHNLCVYVPLSLTHSLTYTRTPQDKVMTLPSLSSRNDSFSSCNSSEYPPTHTSVTGSANEGLSTNTLRGEGLKDGEREARSYYPSERGGRHIGIIASTPIEEGVITEDVWL